MARIASTLLLSLVTTVTIAESSIPDIHAEIDRSVWQVFQSAFEQLDGETLNSVYADDVLRVTPEGLDTAGRFKLANRSRFQGNRERGDRIELDFWFDSRHTSPTVSYDVGFYRVRTTSRPGEINDFYGQFHIVLRNLNGRWKIVQDWDTGSIGGRPITAEDFNRQPPAEFR